MPHSKNKTQNYKMTIPEYLDRLDHLHQQRLMTEAHHLLLQLLPQVQTTIKWKVPYYTYRAPICYLNTTKEYFYFGFVRGVELSNTQGLLTGTDRKLVRLLEIQTLEMLFSEQTAEIILEAALLAEEDGKGWQRTT